MTQPDQTPDDATAARVNRLIVVALAALESEDWTKNEALRQSILALKDGDLQPYPTAKGQQS